MVSILSCLALITAKGDCEELAVDFSGEGRAGPVMASKPYSKWIESNPGRDKDWYAEPVLERLAGLF